MTVDYMNEAEETIDRLWHRYVDLKKKADREGDIGCGISAGVAFRDWRRAADAYPHDIGAIIRRHNRGGGMIGEIAEELFEWVRDAGERRRSVAALIADLVRAGVAPDLIGRTVAALAERGHVIVQEGRGATPQ